MRRVDSAAAPPTTAPRADFDMAGQQRIAVALLEVYAFRAGYDEQLLSVASYMLAVASRLLDKQLCERLDYARCALERAAHRLPPRTDCTRELRALAPHLAELRVCPECNCWRNHTRDCSKERD